MPTSRHPRIKARRKVAGNGPAQYKASQRNKEREAKRRFNHVMRHAAIASEFYESLFEEKEDVPALSEV